MKKPAYPFGFLKAQSVKKTALALAIGCSVPGGFANAATFTVTSMNDTGTGSLREAIDRANAAAGTDDIVFDAALDGSALSILLAINITESITITGNGPGKTIVRMDTAEGAKFNITAANEDITISGITLNTLPTASGDPAFGEMITNGSAVGTGANLSIDNTTFDNSSSVARTRAINSRGRVTMTSSRVSRFNQPMMVNEELIIRDSEFSDNSIADPYGGIIRHTSSSPLSIQDSEFRDNVSTAAGGGATAVNKSIGTTTITSCSFVNNMSGANRSVLDVSGTVTIRDSLFENNLGAAIASEFTQPGETLTIDSSIFRGNSRAIGGAINNEFRTLTITNSVFQSNAAEQDGGAIFSDRNATEIGGTAIRVLQNISIINSTFSANSAGRSGGALRISPRSDSADIALNLLNTTMINNEAKGSGKAINAVPAIAPKAAISATAAAAAKAVVAGSTTLNIYNSVIASSAANGGNDILVGDFNIDSSLIGGSANAKIMEITAGKNLLDVNPQLELLKDNGGKRVGAQKDQALLSHAALDGSPTVGAGNGLAKITLTLLEAGMPKQVVIDLPATDQRGVGFPRITDTTIDMGAIENASIAPVLSMDIPDITVNVRDPVNEDLSVFFTAPNGNALTFSAKNLPANIAISASGVLSGTLTIADAKTLPRTISLTASTDGEDTNAEFNLIFENLTPTLIPKTIPDVITSVGVPIDIALSQYFSDPEMDPLTYTASKLPPDFKVDNAGNLSGSLSVNNIGTLPANIDLTVSDGSNSFATSLAIILKNLPPEMNVNAIPEAVVTINSDFELTLSTFFDDPEQQPLTFTTDGALPNGFSLSEEGVFKGNLAPKDALALGRTIAFTVSDNVNPPVPASFQFGQALMNQGLIQLQPIPDIVVNVRDAASVDLAQYFFALPLSEASGNVAYASENLPNGLTIDVNGVLQGTIAVEAAPTLPQSATLIATRVEVPNSTIRAPFTIRLENLPPATNAENIPDIDVGIGQNIEIDLSQYLSDPENDTLSFSGSGLPNGFAIDTAGVLRGTLAAGDITSLPATIALSISDNINRIDTAFSMKLKDLPPVKINDIPTKPIAVGDSIEFDLAKYFKDPESRPLTFASENIPTGFSLSAEGLFKGTLTEAHTGTIGSIVPFTVSDGINPPVRFSFKLGDSGANQPPALAAVLPAFWFPTGKPTEYNLAQYICDPEAQPLTFSAVNLPSGLSLSAEGKLSGTLEAGDTLPNSFMLVARDAELAFEQEIQLRSGSDAIETPRESKSGGGPVDFKIFGFIALMFWRRSWNKRRLR